MKKYIYPLFLVFLLASCRENEYYETNSLSKLDDDFDYPFTMDSFSREGAAFAMSSNKPFYFPKINLMDDDVFFTLASDDIGQGKYLGGRIEDGQLIIDEPQNPILKSIDVSSIGLSSIETIREIAVDVNDQGNVILAFPYENSIYSILMRVTSKNPVLLEIVSQPYIFDINFSEGKPSYPVVSLNNKDNFVILMSNGDGEIQRQHFLAGKVIGDQLDNWKLLNSEITIANHHYDLSLNDDNRLLINYKKNHTQEDMFYAVASLIEGVSLLEWHSIDNYYLDGYYPRIAVNNNGVVSMTHIRNIPYDPCEEPDNPLCDEDPCDEDDPDCEEGKIIDNKFLGISMIDDGDFRNSGNYWAVWGAYDDDIKKIVLSPEGEYDFNFGFHTSVAINRNYSISSVTKVDTIYTKFIDVSAHPAKINYTK